MSEFITPTVPDQLLPYLTDEVLEIHEEWQAKDLSDVLRDTPDPVTTDYGKAVILRPKDEDDGRTVVIGLPHQQAQKSSRANNSWVKLSVVIHLRVSRLHFRAFVSYLYIYDDL